MELFLALFFALPVEHTLYPRKIEPYQFKFDGSKGFKAYYLISAKLYNGKVPERFEIIANSPTPIELDSKDITVFELDQGANSFVNRHSTWTIEDNYDNKELTLIAYFHIDPAIIKANLIPITVTGKYLSKEVRHQNMFMRDVGRIYGVVGTGVTDQPKAFRVSIAKCMPEIYKIKEKVEAMAKKYGFQIKSYDLRDNYEHLLKKKTSNSSKAPLLSALPFCSFSNLHKAPYAGPWGKQSKRLSL